MSYHWFSEKFNDTFLNPLLLIQFLSCFSLPLNGLRCFASDVYDLVLSGLFCIWFLLLHCGINNCLKLSAGTSVLFTVCWQQWWIGKKIWHWKTGYLAFKSIFVNVSEIVCLSEGFISLIFPPTLCFSYFLLASSCSHQETQLCQGQSCFPEWFHFFHFFIRALFLLFCAFSKSISQSLLKLCKISPGCISMLCVAVCFNVLQCASGLG